MPSRICILHISKSAFTTRRISCIITFILILSGNQVFPQSWLHFSQHELDIWRQRKTSGPYLIIPSKNLSNMLVYEGGWEGLSRNRNSFIANPAQARWIVSPFPPVKSVSNNPPLKASKRMCDAAFVALIENDVALANLVRDHLLWQAQESTTNFNNTAAWQRTYNHIGEVDPNLVASNWGLSHVYAYDLIKDLAEISPEQKAIIHAWLRGMGEYYMAVARAAIDMLFVNPYNNDYRLSSYARTIYNNYPQTLKTHANGNVIQNLHKFFNNRRYSLIRCGAMVGVLLDDAFLKERAARSFKEYLKFGMFPDGMVADYEKAFDANNAPVDANQGWKYSIVPLSVLTDIADAFARSGDKSLFEYQTSEGVFGSEGGAKSLRKGIITFCKHVDGQTAFDEGAMLHYQDGFLDDYTRVISSNNAYNRDNRFKSFHDVTVAMANLYYKDSYIQGTYMRTNPGCPPFITANVAVEVGGADNVEIWGGGFDGIPDMLFMYGQMEDKYNPYADIAISSPADKSIFNAGSSISITVTATSPNTSISKVEFYSGTAKIGETTSSPYSYIWSDLSPGNYTLTAKAIDTQGAITNSSQVNITIKQPNQLPLVNIASPVEGTKFIAPAAIILEASAVDNDGTISKVEFFNGTTLLGEDTDGSNGWRYTWNDVSTGSYALTAISTDNEGGAFTSAIVNIIVKAPNQIPVVDAGNDQTITLPANSVTLTSTAFDPDGSIVTYAWSKKSGPAAVLDGVDSGTLTASELVAGTYVFRLAITDDEGDTVYDDITVWVNSAPAVSITSPSNDASFPAPASITITATATDIDGSVSKVEFYNGDTKLGEDETSPYSFSWNNISAGAFQLTARATDNNGASTTSAIVNIIVKVPNQVPIVNAGIDQTITLPANSITLTGTASDADGNIMTYAWTKQSGSTASLSNSNTQTVTISSLVAGTYVFRLTVTDNTGASAFDEVNVRVNRAPSVSVTSPANNATFNDPASIAIAANASDADGTISKVEFFSGTTKIGEDITSPYSFSWNSVAAGTYAVTARATDNSGATTTSTAVNVIVRSVCTASGRILREVWTNVSGSAVTAIPSTAPSTSTLTLFEAPSNFANNYLQRIRGYICAPATGNYTFYIASDDNSILYLSTDDNPANKVNIASVTGNTAKRQWNKYATQKSRTIVLQAGTRYYIEAMHKDGSGSDNLAVGWITPGSTTINVIPGSVLSPFTSSAARMDVSEEAPQEPLFIVYPNPFDDKITISLKNEADQSVTLVVVDILGREYYRNRIHAVAGETHTNINLSSTMLKPGFYYLKIQEVDPKEKVIKLIKK